MNKAEFENKSLAFITFYSYSLNLIFSGIGFLCTASSKEQLILYQISNAFAITACVMAGRYTGLKGQQVTASGFILLGITHGISLGALSRSSINVDRGMTMLMPMIPALVSMFWCHLFPRWLRILSLIPILFFMLSYIYVEMGQSYYDWPLNLGYGTLQIIEVLWGIYLVRDWKQNINPIR
jgi:hypothetical protein